MSHDLSIQKIYVVGTGESGASSSVEATDDKKVSVYGTDIVKEADSDFSATPLSESPAKEAFKHFGKKYDDLAMMDVNNTIAKLQMQLDDFATECPNAELPKLPKMPDPAKFEKGKDGYQAYKMALMQYENVCSNKIENATKKSLTATIQGSAAETQDVVRSTAKETQMVTIAGAEFLAEKIDESTVAIIANSEEEYQKLEQQIKAVGGKIISVVRQESGKIRVQLRQGFNEVHSHINNAERNIHGHINVAERNIHNHLFYSTNRITATVNNRADGLEDKMDTQHNDAVEYEASLTAYNSRTATIVRTKENKTWGGNTLNLISRQNLPTPVKTQLVKVLTNMMTQVHLSEAEKEHMLGRIKEECANAGVPYQE